MKQLETPVLYLIFNRPDLTEITFARIREVKPTQLFIAADGPRATRPEDIEKCSQARKVVMDMIDWECEVKTLFREENLGCGLAVSRAITWFFENVEEGIILEDDCEVNHSFFEFCTKMLSEFKDDHSVMHIGGGCYPPKKLLKGNTSYYFSKYSYVWGWATWRYNWTKYQFKLDENQINSALSKIEKKAEYNYWNETYSSIAQGSTDAWSIQWAFTIWGNNGLCIYPTRNLVKNIGFDLNATHTKNKIPAYTPKLKLLKLKKIMHPKDRLVNNIADRYVFEKYNLLLNNKWSYHNIKNKIKSYFLKSK